MIKSTLLMVGLLVIVVAATSQSRFGVKTGVNLANQSKEISFPTSPTSTKLDTKPYWGYQVGMFYKRNLSQQLALSAEVNFSTIGSGRLIITQDGTSHDSREKLGYVEVPITLQYFLNKLYFGAGPGISFKVSSRIKNVEDQTFKITNYQTLDAGGNVLLGYTLTKTLDINLRYSHGFMNIYKDDTNAKTRNRFLNLSVLYSLK